MENKKGIQIATINNPDSGKVEVEVDGELVGEFSNSKEAEAHAELLSFLFNMGYKQKETDLKRNLPETYFDYELPDNARFKNGFAGNGSD